MNRDKVMSASEEAEWHIVQAAARWLREHGYLVRWDDDHGCYRVVEEGADRKDDKVRPTEFKSAGDAYYTALRLIAKEIK
jgi:hypothetical protein